MASNFLTWMAAEFRLRPEEVEGLRLGPALEAYITRMETATAHGAIDPLDVISRGKAGGNSRAATKRMLEELAYKPHQSEAIHRMMADRPDGQPGLLRMYRDQKEATEAERRYVRRQAATVLYGPEGSQQRQRHAIAGGSKRVTAPARRPEARLDLGA